MKLSAVLALVLVVSCMYLTEAYRRKDVDKEMFCDVCQSVVHRVHQRVEPSSAKHQASVEQRTVDALDNPNEVCDQGFFRGAAAKLGHTFKGLHASCWYLLERGLDASLEDLLPITTSTDSSMSLSLSQSEARLAKAVCVDEEGLCRSEQLWTAETHVHSLKSPPPNPSEVVSDVWEDSGAVQHLDNVEQVDVFLNSHPVAVVLYGAPWCTHCEEFKETFVLASKRGSSPSIAYGAVNCDTNAEVCVGQHIKQMPTIFLYEQDTGAKTEIDAVKGRHGVEEFLNSIQLVVEGQKVDDDTSSEGKKTKKTKRTKKAKSGDKTEL